MTSTTAAAPWHAEMLDSLARFQATCSQAEFRDGTKAVENATKARELSHWDNYGYLDTLAAAYAKADRFDEAVQWQRQAIAKGPAKMRPSLRAEGESRLGLYEAGQPYHGQYLHTGKLIARYTFDQVSGKTVPDSSGYANDGILVGDARVVDDPARGKVLELDGNGDWVDCGDDPLFGMTEEITLSGWFKTAGPIYSRCHIITKGPSWMLQSGANTVKFVCGVNMPDDVAVNSGVVGKRAVKDRSWHHVAGVYDGRTATLYIDGQRDVSVTVVGSIAENSYNVWIGSDAQRREGNWNVRIYSYALAAKEIKTLYEGKEPPREKRGD